jgi:acyl-CoA thioesterase FadM
MKKEYYEYQMMVTFGDTNAMQNLYFAEYFKIQGTVRERWVYDCIPGALDNIQNGMILSTKSAHCDFMKNFYPFETLLCRMHTEELRKVRVKLVFEFFNKATMDLHAIGWQTIVFKDQNRKTIKMPQNFWDAGKRFLWEPE